MNETSETDQKFCSQCNNGIDVDARFCKYCGFDFANITANVKENGIVGNDPSATESKPSRNHTTFYVFGGFAVLAVLFIAGFIVLKYSNSNSQALVNENFNANSVSPSPNILIAKAQQIEEKILRGEALNASNLEGLSTLELRILRNVHFARYGRKYERPGLGDYFYTRPWYKPSDDYKDSMVNAADKENINLILSIEKPADLQTVSANSNKITDATNSSTSNINSAPTIASSNNVLTNSNVQQAVQSFMSGFTKGGNIIVEGVQELPNENAATADLRFSGWVCSSTNEGGLSKQKPPPVTYDRYGMPSSTFGLRLVTYNTSGLAVLKRYNDGRWVLKQIRVGNGFNAVNINGTQEVR